MKQFFAMAAILAVSSGPALAQEIPEGQSCGGLFCDLGIVGHKTAPAAAPAVPAAPRAVRTEAAPAAEPAMREPKRRIVHRKRVVQETRTAAVPAVPKATPVAAPVAPVVAKRPPPPPSDEPVIFVSPASQTPASALKDMFRPIYR